MSDIAEAMGALKTTYEMADSSDIYGEYGYVEQLEFFEGATEPVDLIKKVWVLQSSEPYQLIPTGWEPPEDEEPEPVRMSRCSSCGRTKPSDINSNYFSAHPDKPEDSDWDGCVQGMGT